MNVGKLGNIDRRSRRGGFTLLEMLVTATLMVIGLMGFARTIALSGKATEASGEVIAATEAARQIVETLQASTFDEVFAAYNETKADDPPNAPGPDFDVPGLEPVPGDPDGQVGKVIFPSSVAGGAVTLREDVIDARLGMPRDLNGDGQIDALPHDTDYQLLPVLVRVEWQGASGRCQLELKTLLADL